MNTFPEEKKVLYKLYKIQHQLFHTNSITHSDLKVVQSLLKEEDYNTYAGQDFDSDWYNLLISDATTTLSRKIGGTCSRRYIIEQPEKICTWIQDIPKIEDLSQPFLISKKAQESLQSIFGKQYKYSEPEDWSLHTTDNVTLILNTKCTDEEKLARGWGRLLGEYYQKLHTPIRAFDKLHIYLNSISVSDTYSTQEWKYSAMKAIERGLDNYADKKSENIQVILEPDLAPDKALFKLVRKALQDSGFQAQLGKQSGIWHMSQNLSRDLGSMYMRIAKHKRKARESVFEGLRKKAAEESPGFTPKFRSMEDIRVFPPIEHLEFPRLKATEKPIFGRLASERLIRVATNMYEEHIKLVDTINREVSILWDLMDTLKFKTRDRNRVYKMIQVMHLHITHFYSHPEDAFGEYEENFVHVEINQITHSIGKIVESYMLDTLTGKQKQALLEANPSRIDQIVRGACADVFVDSVDAYFDLPQKRSNRNKTATSNGAYSKIYARPSHKDTNNDAKPRKTNGGMGRTFKEREEEEEEISEREEFHNLASLLIEGRHPKDLNLNRDELDVTADTEVHSTQDLVIKKTKKFTWQKAREIGFYLLSIVGVVVAGIYIYSSGKELYDWVYDKPSEGAYIESWNLAAKRMEESSGRFAQYKTDLIDREKRAIGEAEIDEDPTAKASHENRLKRFEEGSTEDILIELEKEKELAERDYNSDVEKLSSISDEMNKQLNLIAVAINDEKTMKGYLDDLDDSALQWKTLSIKEREKGGIVIARLVRSIEDRSSTSGVFFDDFAQSAIPSRLPSETIRYIWRAGTQGALGPIIPSPLEGTNKTFALGLEKIPGIQESIAKLNPPQELLLEEIQSTFPAAKEALIALPNFQKKGDVKSWITQFSGADLDGTTAKSIDMMVTLLKEGNIQIERDKQNIQTLLPSPDDPVIQYLAVQNLKGITETIRASPLDATITTAEDYYKDAQNRYLEKKVESEDSYIKMLEVRQTDHLTNGFMTYLNSKSSRFPSLYNLYSKTLHVILATPKTPSLFFKNIVLDANFKRLTWFTGMDKAEWWFRSVGTTPDQSDAWNSTRYFVNGILWHMINGPGLTAVNRVKNVIWHDIVQQRGLTKLRNEDYWKAGMGVLSNSTMLYSALKLANLNSRYVHLGTAAGEIFAGWASRASLKRSNTAWVNMEKDISESAYFKAAFWSMGSVASFILGGAFWALENTFGAYNMAYHFFHAYTNVFSWIKWTVVGFTWVWQIWELLGDSSFLAAAISILPGFASFTSYITYYYFNSLLEKSAEMGARKAIQYIMAQEWAAKHKALIENSQPIKDMVRSQQKWSTIALKAAKLKPKEGKLAIDWGEEAKGIALTYLKYNLSIGVSQALTFIMGNYVGNLEYKPEENKKATDNTNQNLASAKTKLDNLADVTGMVSPELAVRIKTATNYTARYLNDFKETHPSVGEAQWLGQTNLLAAEANQNILTQIRIELGSFPPEPARKEPPLPLPKRE